MKKYIGVTKPLNIIAIPSANLDAKYGTHDSIQDAIDAIPETLREIGLTVGIIINNKVVEYWWESGVSDSDLIVKTISSLSQLDNTDTNFIDEGSVNKSINKETTRAIAAETKLNSEKLDASIYNSMYNNGVNKRTSVKTYNGTVDSLESVYGLTADVNGANGKAKQNGWDVEVRKDETKGGKSNRYNWNGEEWIDMNTGTYPEDVAAKKDSENYEVTYAPNGLMPQWAVISNGTLNIDTVNERLVANGDVIISWGKGYTTIVATNLEVPFDNSAEFGMTGLIAIFYVRKTRTFRFIRYSSFTEITNDYLLIATLQNKKLIFTASKLQLNGEYQSLMDIDDRVKLLPNSWCSVISGVVNVDTINSKVILSGSTLIHWGKEYKFKTFNTEVILTGGEMAGLSVLYYDKKNSDFKFIRYDGGLSTVTPNYLIVAIFQNTKLVATLSSIMVNGKQAVENSTNRPYLNKRWGIIGDSITTQASVINDDGSYTVNRTNWSTHAEVFFEPKEWHNMAMSGGHYCDFTTTNDFQKMSHQVNVLTSNFKDLDYIVISLGTNDMTWKHTLGTYDSTMIKSIEELDLSVFYDALRHCYFKLREAYSDAVIFVATPLQIADFDAVYTEREPYYAAIKIMANRYNCIIIDTCNESGIISDFEVKSQMGRFLKDGLHPNEVGKVIQGLYMVNEITSKLY